MQFYYDIDLHFDEYYINYYLWDSVEHFNRLPIFKISNIRIILDNEVLIKTDYKNIIVSDGVSSLALELINNKVSFISSLPYKDEFKINKIVMDMDETLDIEKLKKKNLKLNNNLTKVKNIYLNMLEDGNEYFIKYIYYELTGKLSNNIKSMKKYLIDEIKNNFCDKYYQLYDKIIIGD
ncbi:MAG: hypothetical protein J1F35_04475 [Erysipelotrichales bacterium]|nr:hypothetical protein [Erysipelotrichales bacterium]